jgi:alpha-L-arabinofuranosidase
LYVIFNGSGTVWIDYISLFPESTYKNRPNGLRRDVAEFLEAMHPAFIRWPGGCIVEGISLINRVEWKKTLGDPADRPGQYDTWGYHNSYGFGYHEYLQFCEDIGAKAMFVCNVGLGCQYRVGDACSEGEVQYYINDVLDAIEYATGDKSTSWGAKRVAAGHPDPFPLQYIEIGNENWGPVYNKRCDMFYKAIKARYPQLTLISNHGLTSDMTGVEKVDMIDPHWYVEPDYFFKNTRIFDTVPRKDHLIYVGEYACNQKVGGGNMLAALSEAAFITGMERNSDIVRMASYAPLFECRNDRTWPVNLIWYDNLQVVGRSSYYVQKVFAENRPSRNLHSEIHQRGDIPSDSLRQFAVAGLDEQKGEIVIKVVNAVEKPWRSGIKITGGKKIMRKGEVVTLAASSLADENSYTEPQRISPVATEFGGFSDDFIYDFKPCSLTVLRLKVK